MFCWQNDLKLCLVQSKWYCNKSGSGYARCWGPTGRNLQSNQIPDASRLNIQNGSWLLQSCLSSKKLQKCIVGTHEPLDTQKKQKFKVPQSRSGEITLVLHKILAKTKSLKFVSVGHICLIFCCDNPCHDLKKRVLRVVSVKSWRWNLLRNLMHAFCVEQITCKRPSFLQSIYLSLFDLAQSAKIWSPVFRSITM